MKLSNDFILREIAGECMLVPVGTAAAGLNGLVVLNECGGTIFKALQKGSTEEELVEAVLAEYNVDRKTAAADVTDFLDQLRSIGALIDENL